MEKNRRLDEGALRRLLEREQTGPEALVLRLAWLEGLTREEIAALTWTERSGVSSGGSMRPKRPGKGLGTPTCFSPPGSTSPCAWSPFPVWPARPWTGAG